MSSSHQGHDGQSDPSGTAPVADPLSPPTRASLWRLATPQFFALAVEPVTGLADTWFVSDLGELPLASLGVGVTVMTGTVWLFNFLGVCGATETARSFGAGQVERLRVVTATMTALSVAFGLFLAGLLLGLSKEILELFELDRAAVPSGSRYLQIRSASAPFVIFLLAGTGVLRGLQDMRTPMWIAVLTALLNIGLDALLVPTMGLRGAAIGTTVAQAIGAIALAVCVFRRVGLAAPSAREVPLLLRVGRDMFLRTAALHVFLFATVRRVNDIGIAAAAAHHVVRQVWLLTAMLLDAFAVSTQSLVGYFVGASRRDLARKAVRIGVEQSVLGGVALGLGMYLVTDLVAAEAFQGSFRERAIEAFSAAWLVACLSQPINALAFASDGALWAVSRYAFLRNVMLLATGVGVAAIVFADSLTMVWIAITGWTVIRAGFGVSALRSI